MSRQPAVHWAWIVLIVCFFNLFINYSVRLGYGVVLPFLIALAMSVLAVVLRTAVSPKPTVQGT